MVNLSNVSLSELAAATGNLDFGGYKGVNVADPGADQDAATKKYHDDDKYTDADAVAAVLADDKYIRNYEDDLSTGKLDVTQRIGVRELENHDYSFFVWVSAQGYARFKMRYDFINDIFEYRDDLHSVTAYSFDGEYHDFKGLKIKGVGGIRDAVLSGTPKIITL